MCNSSHRVCTCTVASSHPPCYPNSSSHHNSSHRSFRPHPKLVTCNPAKRTSLHSISLYIYSISPAFSLIEYLDDPALYLVNPIERGSSDSECPYQAHETPLYVSLYHSVFKSHHGTVHLISLLILRIMSHVLQELHVNTRSMLLTPICTG